ncbi:Streptothricin hydrolase [Leucoagaricus sp. SymC.cos]|nr:Streptothricin hydrolase [Leucoagaricus sp. SymC.cos]
MPSLVAAPSFGISQSTNSSTTTLSEPTHVLLLLDTQECVLSPDEKLGGIPKAHFTRDNIKLILETARKAQPPPLIVHIRNTGDIGDPDDPNAPGWELIFSPLPGELVIDKRKNNAFAGTKLGDHIPTDAYLIVVGFQTDFSIRATCSAALGRGNEVLLVRGAHKTLPRIEVLHGGGITPAEEVEFEIEEELTEAGVHILEMDDVEHIFDSR